MNWSLQVLILVALGFTFALGSYAAEKEFTRGAKILLLGDSTLDVLRGEHRVEKVMMKKLKALYPRGRFEVVNLARGGMWIGPADTTGIGGIARPLFESDTKGWYFRVLRQCPKADAIFVMFGGNDSKVYPPKVFGEKLAALCDRLAKDYPNAKVFLATEMYQDPKHSGRYWRTPSMVKEFKQGDNRNKYLKPFYDQIRELAKKRGLVLADACERIKAETEAGNWDLRMRRDGTLDASKDAEHVGDMGWHGNIHSNPEGVKVIADVLVKTLFGMDALKPDGPAPAPPQR